MVLSTDELQLSRGESVRDTAYVLSRHVAAIGIRTGPDELVAELAEHASVPVINMLTAGHHPCQALADLLTLRETFGELEGLTLAYVGDGNNVARSLAILGALAGVQVRIASPPEYSLAEPPAGAMLSEDPRAAVEGADAVYTDVWVSMSDDPASADERRQVLAPYRLDDSLLDLAAPDAIALHCLPAHPGEEITAEVLYGARQRIWDQAENRRHAQKALLELLTEGVGSARSAAVRRHAANFRARLPRGIRSRASVLLGGVTAWLHRGLQIARATRGPRSSESSGNPNPWHEQPNPQSDPHHWRGRRGALEPAEQLANRIIKPLGLVVLSRERIQQTLDEAAERGRLTRSDANELVSVLVERGRQQTDELLTDLERLLGRGRQQLDTATRKARRSEPLDRLVRGADRARRTVGVSPSFPIIGYDELTSGQVQIRLGNLTQAELRKVREYERGHANRKSVLTTLGEKLLG